MAQKKGEIVVGLDIGTTKICCIVGEVTPDGIDVIGIGNHVSIHAPVKGRPAMRRSWTASRTRFQSTPL